MGPTCVLLAQWTLLSGLLLISFVSAQAFIYFYDTGFWCSVTRSLFLNSLSGIITYHWQWHIKVKWGFVKYISFRRTYHVMMTPSNGNIFRVTGPLCGEFTGPGEFPTQRPVMWGFDVFFDLRLNKRLSKQPWSWWFETPSWSLWRQCNYTTIITSRPGQDGLHFPDGIFICLL